MRWPSSDSCTFWFWELPPISHLTIGRSSSQCLGPPVLGWIPKFPYFYSRKLKLKPDKILSGLSQLRPFQRSATDQHREGGQPIPRVSQAHSHHTHLVGVQHPQCHRWYGMTPPPMDPGGIESLKGHDAHPKALSIKTLQEVPVHDAAAAWLVTLRSITIPPVKEPPVDGRMGGRSSCG